LQKRQSATALEASPDEERRSRLIKYTVAMSSGWSASCWACFTQGWLMWVFFALAIFLPYFAVVIANEQGSTKKVNTTVIAPKVSIKADQIKFDDPK
jgi:CHASE2 domain-containing sensor protein